MLLLPLLVILAFALCFLVILWIVNSLPMLSLVGLLLVELCLVWVVVEHAHCGGGAVVT